MLETLYRQSMLRVSALPAVKKLLTGQGMKFGVNRFVAGETLEEALPALGKLESKGLLTNLDFLGEFVSTEAAAAEMTQSILSSLSRLSKTPHRYMSVKPSQLGLGISFELGLSNARSVVALAHDTQAHICFDMENHPFVETTLRLYQQLRSEGFANISTVLQSYLHRSMADLKPLLALEPKPTLRLVKGAYRESPEVAFQDKRQVNQLLKEMIYLGLEAGAKINIASHDEALIAETEAFIKGSKLAYQHYEYQLLYGVKPNLQVALAQKGHPVRIYVPFGKDWYGYFSRRLAERPANLAFVLRGLFG